MANRLNRSAEEQVRAEPERIIREASEKRYQKCKRRVDQGMRVMPEAQLQSILRVRGETRKALCE